MTFGEWVAAVGAIISALATAIVAPMVAIYRKLDRRIAVLEGNHGAATASQAVMQERVQWIDQTLKKVEAQQGRMEDKVDKLGDKVDEKIDRVLDAVSAIRTKEAQ